MRITEDGHRALLIVAIFCGLVEVILADPRQKVLQEMWTARMGIAYFPLKAPGHHTADSKSFLPSAEVAAPTVHD